MLCQILLPAFTQAPYCRKKKLPVRVQTLLTDPLLLAHVKHSPCNCKSNTCPLNGSCQHINLVCYCKVLTPEIKQNYSHYFRLTKHALKDRLYKHNNSFKYESKWNSTEVSSFIWSKKKEKVNMNQMIGALWITQNLFHQFEKQCMLHVKNIIHHYFLWIRWINAMNWYLSADMRMSSTLQITKT